MKLWDVVVVGATGLVGRTILTVLEQRNFPVDHLIPVASSRSVGKEILFKNHPLRIVPLSEDAFVHAEIAFFAAGGAVSEHWVPIAANHADIVIDNSSVFRMRRDIPLVVPEVNPRQIFLHGSRIIANPNCSTIQLVAVLKPLHDAFTVKRVVVSTYQAVSGAGQRGVNQLRHEILHEPVASPKFPHSIASNVLPHIDLFYSDGFTREEYKMMDETRKILHDPTIRVAPTCVRVPVLNAHSESVNIEFAKPYELRAVVEILSHAPGLVLVDAPEENAYPMPAAADGRDEVYVGRLRRDETISNGLSLWIVADNLRKGAATNAVQIAEAWLKGPGHFRVEIERHPHSKQ